MKNQFGILLATLLLSTGVQASQQLSFNGHLVATSGSLAVGDSFSGQFTFNQDMPDFQGYLSNLLGQNAGPPQTYFRNYQQNQSSSFNINGGPTITGTESIGWALHDNVPVLAPPPLGAVIPDGNNLLDGYVTPGTYDIIHLRAAHADQPLVGPLSPGTLFSIIAIFNPDTFALDGTTPISYQSPFSGQPVFLGFEIYSPDRSALGIFDYTNTSNLAAVPVPSAIWLFGSALTGLTLRFRQRR